MIVFTTAHGRSDLEGILALQKSNLARNLSAEEIQHQGFVTVDHSYDQLKKLNDNERHVIAKEGDRVVGYVLAMTSQSKFDIPIIIPMFEAFDGIVYRGRKVTQYNYIVVGQVCIDKEYRGRGIFDECYSAYKTHYSGKYDFAITEIARTNQRSLNAHKRIGFKEVHSYFSQDNSEWIIVLWDWKST
jgi:GNAT superfamily N-acetyltransferase